MIPLYQVDSFTQEKFKGNPAGVVLLDKEADETWMQHIAAEMNLSETAFVSPAEDGYNLCWFTPVAEVDLCGHATLASAHILYETRRLAETETARFHSKSGLLTVEKKNDLLEMNFPAEPATEIPPPPVLVRALGFAPIFTGQNRMDLLVEMVDPAMLLQLEPDFHELAQIPVRGIIITSRPHDAQYDFISRFFAPRFNINEDPVTGSAHCCLTPYWAAKLGKSTMVAYQASARSGIVFVQNLGDRVLLAGHAVTIFQADLI
jgi:PhzF family phenazine biosynthesis protein